MFKERHTFHEHIEALMRYSSLIETIDGFWLERTNRETDSWRDHILTSTWYAGYQPGS